MTPQRERQLWRIGLVLVLALFAWQELHHRWSAAPEPTTTILLHRTVKQVRGNRPTASPGLVERIMYVPVVASRLQLSDPRTDLVSVNFCQDLSTRTDSTASRPRLLLDAGAYRGRTLTLWGVRSDASAFSAVFPGVQPPMRFGVEADSLYVRQERGWLHIPGWLLATGKYILVAGVAYKVGQTAR